MDVEKIGIHLRDKFSGDVIGLTFMFNHQDPLDIAVSWINAGEELDSVKNIFTSLLNDPPQKCEIDEEGEYVIITPQTSVINQDVLELTFSSDRRKPFDTFTVKTNKIQFKTEFERAIKQYEDTKTN